MLGIFINNNAFLESKSKVIFNKDTDFTHNPPFVFYPDYLQTNSSNTFNNSYLFKSYTIFENYVNFFSCRFLWLLKCCKNIFFLLYQVFSYSKEYICI